MTTATAHEGINPGDLVQLWLDDDHTGWLVGRYHPSSGRAIFGIASMGFAPGATVDLDPAAGQIHRTGYTSFELPPYASPVYQRKAKNHMASAGWWFLAGVLVMVISAAAFGWARI